LNSGIIIIIIIKEEKEGKKMEIHVSLQPFITRGIKQNITYHKNLFTYNFKNKHRLDIYL
jgi:hypothetical protein